MTNNKLKQNDLVPSGSACKPRLSASRYLIKGLLALLLASPFGQAFALACLEQGTSNPIKSATLPANIAVPANAPDGTVIWESQTYTVNVRCYHDWDNREEAVYFYVNPAYQPIATGTMVGVRYNNQLYTQSSGRISTGKYIPAYGEAYFTMSFSVVVLKNGTVPTTGQSAFYSYRVFQLDGIDGINANPNKNLNFVLNGNVRFIGCTADLSFAPSIVLDFGTIPTGGTSGAVAGERPFSMTATRNCSSPYALRVLFRTASSTPGGYMSNESTYKMNNGLGLSFVDANSGSTIPMNAYIDFVTLAANNSASRSYKARLTRMASSLTPGSFTANVVVELEYY